MQVPSVLAVLVITLVAFAGCLSAERTPVPGEDDVAEPARAPPVLPDNFTREESVVAVTPLSGLLSTTSCGDAASGICYRYEIGLEDPARLTATLSWQTQTNDFDLVLLDGNEVLARSQDLPPGTKEALTATLGAGTYDLMVVAYIVSVDTFHLDAVFTST